MKLDSLIYSSPLLSVLLSILHSLFFTVTSLHAQIIEDRSGSVILAEVTDAYGERQVITFADLKAAIELAPKDQSARETLDQLIELNQLSQEAKRQQLHLHPLAIDTRDRVAIKRMISDRFETTYRLDKLPQKYIQQSIQQNLGRFKHPELRQGAHILIKPVNSERQPMTKSQEVDLTPLIERIKSDLAHDPIEGTEQLQSRVQRYRPWVQSGYEVIFENLGRFSRRGPFIMSFNEACFAVDEAPQLIGPIITPFGFHFTWIDSIIPPLDTPDEEIEREVRRRILPEVRGYEWRKLITTLFQAAEADGR